MKQLDLAWMIYASEFNERLPVNPVGNANDAIGTPGGVSPAWVAGWEVYTPNISTDNTNTLLLVAPNLQQYGSIGGYIKSAGTYHCPGDTSTDPKYGPRVRSCSMNGLVGYADPTGGYNPAPEIAGYQIFLKSTDFRKLSPSSAFVFLDERASSIDDGWFFVDPQGYKLSGIIAMLTVNNLPAVYHNQCSSFSFADGHAEIHKWLSHNFATLSGNSQSTTYTDTENGFSDVYWLVSHATTTQ